MKIGIIGLPQTGKKTLFELLTGDKVDDQGHGGKSEVKLGIARLRDGRFDKLVEMYEPNKQVPATLEVVLLPKFDKESILSGELLKAVEKCDALCHVVRAFDDESVFHVEGSVDSVRDIEMLNGEFILGDLVLIEKRIERMSLAAKKGVAAPQQDKEQEILLRMKKMLEESVPLVNFELNDDEKKLMSTYQFLTRRPMILVLNVNDDALSDESLVKELSAKYESLGMRVMQISAKIEAELNSLADEERETFLQELNIIESALNRLSRLYYDALGLISFYTVGKDEVRAWATRKGSPAPEAAGTIHSDMQRGFIRAEIMKTGDLFELGSESKLKEVGKAYLKGKDYIVEDGDIMHVRFNV